METMPTRRGCSGPCHFLASAFVLLLLPALNRSGVLPSTVPRAVQESKPLEPGPRTLSPLPPGPTAAQPRGHAQSEGARPRGAESRNGSIPGAASEADGPEGKAGESSLGGSLAVSPNPSDKPMTQRALTVLVVVSAAVLVYFVVRTVRMRRRNRKTRRYGVLDTNIENMELTPLEQDDEDDDNTLFDANHPRR